MNALKIACNMKVTQNNYKLAIEKLSLMITNINDKFASKSIYIAMNDGDSEVIDVYVLPYDKDTYEILLFCTDYFKVDSNTKVIVNVGYIDSIKDKANAGYLRDELDTPWCVETKVHDTIINPISADTLDSKICHGYPTTNIIAFFTEDLNPEDREPDDENSESV
jgi:hypothetical protein